MTLEEAILEDAAQKISDDIDKQVLKGMGYVFDYYLEHGRGTIYGQEYLSVAPINAVIPSLTMKVTGIKILRIGYVLYIDAESKLEKKTAL